MLLALSLRKNLLTAFMARLLKAPASIVFGIVAFSLWMYLVLQQNL